MNSATTISFGPVVVTAFVLALVTTPAYLPLLTSIGLAWFTLLYASTPMSTHGLPLTVHPYDTGSLPVATRYQTCAWYACPVPCAAAVSISSVHPAGPLTVDGSASTSSVASRRSPATTPLGFATVVPLVTVVRLRNAGTAGAAFVVVNVKSPDVLTCPYPSRLCTR